ncbi:hypothetical protein [Endozoicomonas ascidiicola]|uniref:hypothetical protein n=1 Tax=Endozoicomonas ascidiicola TaxID=1698521 RepID=UPI00082EC9CA|nr:hypothetical protein [Endozoicomonas ascidiicola]
MLTTSAAGLNPVLSSSISLQQEQSGKAKRLGASRRNVKLSKHCQLIHGLRARKCTRASAHKVEKRYHSATDRISNTLTVVNNGNLSSNNKALKKCSAAIKKIDAALFDRKTKLMEGHRHKPCRTRKGRAYNKSDKSQKCTLVALSRQLKRCNGVVPENTRTRSVRSANSSTAEKNNELATVHQLQQQSAQAQRKITRQLPDASTDTSNVSGKKTTSPFCKDLKNFQIPQRFQIENAQPSTSPVTDKLRSLQSYLKAIDLATDSRKGFLASLTQANADSAGILSDLIKVGQALEQRIAVHSRMLSSRSYSRPCKTSNGQRETLADSQSHMIALINAYELGCSQLGISPEVASVTNEDLPSSEGEEIVALLPNLKSVDRSLNQVSMMQRNIDRTTQIVNEAHLHANLTTSATPSHNVMMIVAERQAIDDLLNSVVNQRWAVQVDNYIKNNRDIITNVSENEINDLLNTLPIIKAYLKLSTLRVLIGNYKKGLASINEDNASAGYQQLLEYINNNVSSLAPLETSGGRKKRSIEDDQQQLESTIEASMDKLLQQPYSNGFSDYCRGYQDYLTHFLNKLRGNNDDSEHQWDVDDQALSEAIEAKKFNIQTQNNLLSNTKECFSRNDYYQAGQKSCVSSMMLMVSYMASNPIKALQKFQKESMESEFQLTSMLDDSFSVVTEINSIDASNLYNLVIMGNPFYFSELKKDADGNCFATALLQAIAGNLNYYKNVFSAIEIGSFQTQPILSTANILQLISRLGIMEHNMMLESTDTEGRILLSNSISRVQNLLVKEGFDIQSYFLKKLQEDIYEIHSDISDLPSVNINTSDMSTSGFGRHMLKEYKIAKRIALESGRSISQLTFMIHLDYGDAGHETIGSVTENADGSVTLCFEDSNSGITSLTGDSLEFLLTHAHLFDVHVGDRLDKLETGDLENPHPQEFNIIQLTPEIISRISRLQILPSNPLSLADIARAPFDTVPVLEQKRRLENYRQLFSKLKDNRIYNAFTNIAKKKQVPNPEKVSSSDPLDYQVREILTAINECETTGALPDKSVIMLVKNVINEFSRVFNVIEKLADQQFINGFDAQFLESVTELSVSMMDLPENKIGSSRFSSLIKTFKKQVKKFKSRLDTNHEKLSVSDSASTGSKKALSADEQLQMQKNLLGVLAEKKSLPSWLSGFKKQSSATSSDQTQLQAEQALMNELRNFGSLFFSLTGHLPAGVSSSEGITLTDEAKIIARYGIKKVLDMSSESLLLSPEVNPIFAGIMNDPVIKPLLVRMNDYFATKPSSSTSSTTEIVLGSLGGAGLLGGAVAGIYKSVSSRISSAGDSGAGRGVLVDEEVTDEEVNAVLEELGIEPVNPEPVSQPEANPSSEDIEMPDLPDAPNHPLIPNTETEEVEDSEAGAQKVKIRCKKSTDGGCSRRPEDEEDTNVETENAADEADFFEPEAILEDLPGLEAFAGTSAAPAARRELFHLKNIKRSSVSAASSTSNISRTSSTARLLPSTTIKWASPRISMTSIAKVVRVLSSAGARVLGLLADAALPITYGVAIGIQLSNDIGKWVEQESYEQGLTTLDDVMSYISFIFPAAMFWPKQAPRLALQRMTEIKDRFVPWLSIPTSPLESLAAYEELFLVASDPDLGEGHARYQYPDGSALYRISYNKTDVSFLEDEQIEDFDQMLLGETTSGRVDVYIITKKGLDGSQVVVASGTAFGISQMDLDKKNAKFVKSAFVVRALGTINQKYVFETLDLDEELRKIYAERPVRRGYVPKHLFRENIRKATELRRAFPKLKAEKEAESRNKVAPIYGAIEKPLEKCIFEGRRAEAKVQMFFKTTDMAAANNGTASWQMARNQHTSFMLTEADEGYRDEVTLIYAALDPEYRKRVKPALIGLERENLPTENTDKALIQQARLTQYLTLNGQALADLVHLYPDTLFKSSDSGEGVSLYASEETGAPESTAARGFAPDVVAVPDILKNCRHAKYNAADKHMESFHSTYDDVMLDLNFQEVQENRAEVNQHFLNAQTFTYYDVVSSDKRVLVQRQVSVGALLQSINGNNHHPSTPRAWRHYSAEARHKVYHLALQQVSGESSYIPIMDSHQRGPMQPVALPIIREDGDHQMGAFVCSPDNVLQQIDRCMSEPCELEIDVLIPWHHQNKKIRLYQMSDHNTGDLDKVSARDVELTLQPNERKMTFSKNVFQFIKRHEVAHRTYRYKLFFVPYDENGQAQDDQSLYIANLTSGFFKQKRDVQLSREHALSIASSSGQFKLTVTGFSEDSQSLEISTTRTLEATDILHPTGSVSVRGRLAPGRYVLKSGNGINEAAFVVTPQESALRDDLEACLPVNDQASLATVKQSLENSVQRATRYGAQWRTILVQLLSDGVLDDQVTKSDVEKYQTSVTEYLFSDDQYQPCQTITLVEASQRYLNCLVNLIALCEHSPHELSQSQLTRFMKDAISLPPAVMETYVTSQVAGWSVTNTTNSERLESLAVGNHTESRHGRRLLSLESMEATSSGNRLVSPLASAGQLFSKAAQFPRGLMLTGAAFAESMYRVFKWSGNSESQAETTSGNFSFSVGASVLSHCDKNMSNCTPGQVSVKYQGQGGQACALLGAKGDMPCEHIDRIQSRELPRHSRSRNGLKRIAPLDLSHEMAGRALDRWQQDTGVMSRGELHPLAMPGTKTQSWQQVLEQYENNLGSAPKGYGKNLDQKLTYSSFEGATLDCQKDKRCTLSLNTNEQPWNERIAAQLSAWLYGDKPELSDNANWVSPETYKQNNNIMSQSLRDDRTRISEDVHNAGNALYGFGELLNVLLHKVNHRVLVPSYRADAGRMLATSVNELQGSNIPYADFVQSSYDLMPDLIQGLETYMANLARQSSLSSQWTEADKLNLAIVSESHFAEQVSEGKNLLSQGLIERFLINMLDSPVGPEHERTDNIFELDHDERTWLKGSAPGLNAETSNNVSQQQFFTDAGDQPHGKPAIHFIRGMLNALAVGFIKMMKTQNDDDLIDIAMSFKQPQSPFASVADYLPTWPSQTNSKVHSRKVYGDLLASLRKQGSLDSDTDVSPPPNKKQRMSAHDQSLLEKTNLQTYVIKLIAAINQELTDCNLSTLDKRRLVDCIWNVMHEKSSDSIAGRAHARRETKKQLNHYHTIHQNVVRYQPEDLKCPEIDQSLESELVNDVAFSTYLALGGDGLNSSAMTSSIQSQWKSQAADHYKTNLF